MFCSDLFEGLCVGYASKICPICGRWFLTLDAWHTKDCNNEWGGISLDFENSTAEIIRMADWRTMLSNINAKQMIRYLLECENGNLPKRTMLVFEKI